MSTKPPVVLALAERARPIAEQAAVACKAELCLPARADDIRAAFTQGRPIVAVMAVGALARIVAPLLEGKQQDPPVIAVSEDGGAVVPVFGGHHGGNDLARKIGEAIGAVPAITTASDLAFGVALDDPPAGYTLINPEDVKSAVTSVLDGRPVQRDGAASWLDPVPTADDGVWRLTVTTRDRMPAPQELLYVERRHVLGMGCERGCSVGAARDIASQAIRQAGISEHSIAALVTIDVKADEAALHAVANELGVPLRVFPADVLELQANRLANPSEVVFAEVGCHGVAEGAALSAVGKEGSLIVPKIKNAHATAAVARAPTVLHAEETGRGQGTLFVVGLGPGQPEWRSPEVSRMLMEATDWVGYSLYLDLAGDLNTAGAKTRHDFPLGDEEKRVRHALELAGEGRTVALICSGDAGIYAMATLVFEAIDGDAVSDPAKRVAIEVSPGISALQAAAARAGAPLGHDFCTISLSDLLTPWDAIERRIAAAAQGDFVIAFYNPVSKRRRTQLAHAKAVLLEHRPADTPVVLAASLGRPEESVHVVPLSDLEVDDVDMLTTVVVGSPESRTVKTGDGKTWVYTPRGYANKDGTRLKERQT
ncbi:MAG: precorrin-3B C(17)-methyltransferase [Pseudomonadota bacterium]